MRKDIGVLITILVGVLALVVIDLPDFVNRLKNENIFSDKVNEIQVEGKFYDLKEKENNFWDYLKNGKDEEVIAEDPLVTPSPEPSNVPVDTPTPTPTPEGPLTLPLDVMLIGDSMMLEGFGPKLEQDLLAREGIKVSRYGKYSTGLNRRDYYDWFSVSKNYLNAENPDVLIVFFGANDGQKITDLETKKIHELYSAGWEGVYRKRVKDYLAIAAPRVKKLYWMGHPIPGNSDFHRKFEMMNRIYKEEAAAYDNVVFVDSWDRFSVNGKYSAYLKDDSGKSGLVKGKDGVHLTWHGATILSQFLFKEMRKDIDFTAPQ